MGNRLSRIVTRTGDDGTTGLGDGTRVPKDDVRIEAMGAVDELNCAIGVLLSLGLPEEPPTRQWLVAVQNDLFDLGGELALPGRRAMGDARVERLERHLAELNATLPPLREFLLPGGTPAAAACHLARATCRRAERRGWTLVRAQGAAALSAAALRYLNRLSDLLFVVARVYARADGASEELWQPTRDAGEVE